MRIILKPSLERIALVNIAATLWCQNDIKKSIDNCLYSRYRNNIEGKEIENRLTEKVSHLPLPELLKEKVSNFIKPIGLEILKWIAYHCTRHHFYLNVAIEFCWTPEGTIDRKKTAEVIIKNNHVDINTRYRLACLYCIEDDILELWSKNPDEKKIISFNACILTEVNSHQYNMLLYWRKSNRYWQNNTTISYQIEFEACIKDGNKAAASYFLRKLTPTERDKSLLMSIKSVVDNDIFIFLLSQMKEEQQEEIFKSLTYTVLTCFLDWPFQSFFMEIVDRMNDFLSRWNIIKLVHYFVYKDMNGYKDCNYKRLFGKFLQKGSCVVKSHVIGHFTDRGDSSHLFLIKDIVNLKLLLQDASVIEKKKLIYSEIGKDFCQVCIYEEEWDLLGFFVEKCLLSKDEMMKFKEKIEKCHSVSDDLARNKGKWDELFSFPNKSVRNYNKRECAADEGNLSKIIRCTQ